VNHSTASPMARPRTPPAKQGPPFWIAPAPRRRGRPASKDDAAKREKHIECATLMLMTKWPVKRIAASLGIHRDTAYAWLKLALSYPGARCEALRQLAAMAKPRAKAKKKR
jgi:hypothetical protein